MDRCEATASGSFSRVSYSCFDHAYSPCFSVIAYKETSKSIEYVKSIEASAARPLLVKGAET